MKNLPSNVVLSIGFLALTGCATSVQFQALHGPAWDLNGARKVKIGKLAAQSRPSTPTHGFLDLFGNILASIFDESRDAKRTTWIREDLATKLKSTGALQLVDADTFDIVLEGSYSFDLSDTESGSNGADGVSIVRTATTKIVYVVTNKSGRLLVNDSAEGNAQATGTGKSTSDATIDLMNWSEDVLRRSIGSAHIALSHAFAPYRTVEHRQLATGDDRSIKSANKLAAEGRWEEAVSVWRRTLAGTTKDRTASLRNLAIYHESRGELDSALTRYEQAQILDASRGDEMEIRRTKRWILDNRRLDKDDSVRLAPGPRENARNPFVR